MPPPDDNDEWAWTALIVAVCALGALAVLIWAVLR